MEPFVTLTKVTTMTANQSINIFGLSMPLYDQGNDIHYWTTRGAISKKNGMN